MVNKDLALSTELIGSLTSEYEYDYEDQFSFLSRRTSRNVDLET